MCIDIGALLLKRTGRLYLAGTILITTTELGLFSAVLSLGHLDVVNLPLLDQLLQSVVVAMAFFPPITVFFITLLNCAFIAGSLMFQPHTVALDHNLAHNFLSILFPSILLQIFVAGVSFIIIRALIKEIRRADTAEELAQLRQSEAELREREAEQARQLEEGIQLILQALNTAAARGDFSMRIPLAQENILWRVGYSINNLLARLQGFKQEKSELDKTRAVANQLTECIRQGQYFPLSKWTGTSLDQVIIEINKQLGASARPLDQPLDQPPSHTASSRYR
jgi:hypothetical protein